MNNPALEKFDLLIKANSAKTTERYEEAVRLYKEYLNTFPDDAKVLINLGDVQVMLGEVPAAIVSFAQAIKSDKSLMKSCMSRMTALKSIDNFKKQFINNQKNDINIDKLQIIPQTFENDCKEKIIRENINEKLRLAEQTKLQRQQELVTNQKAHFEIALKEIELAVRNINTAESPNLEKHFRALADKAFAQKNVKFFELCGNYFKMLARTAQSSLLKEQRFNYAMQSYRQALYFAPFNIKILDNMKSLESEINEFVQSQKIKFLVVSGMGVSKSFS